MEPPRLFVYGTLQPGGYYYRQYCLGRTSAERPARIRGLLYELPAGYPAAIRGDAWIYGWLLEFSGPEIWPFLDYVEDYQPGRPPEENEYLRTRVEAFAELGEPLGVVWTYLMTEQRLATLPARWLPSGRWPVAPAELVKEKNLQLRLARWVIPDGACSDTSTSLTQDHTTGVCATGHEYANG